MDLLNSNKFQSSYYLAMQCPTGLKTLLCDSLQKSR